MLITLRNITVRFTDRPVLESINLTIDENDRIALVGRNGAGKSTLMKVLSGQLSADDGTREHPESLKVAWLPQDTPIHTTGTVRDLVTAGLKAIDSSSGALKQSTLDSHRPTTISDSWDSGPRVEALLSRMGLTPQAQYQSLSGGLKRQALLAAALVGSPDLLLLDEPTNHLDIEGISWLEQQIRSLPCAVVCISHDRSFLDAIATRIVELDRGQLQTWPGDYAQYREMKRSALNVELEQRKKFDKKLQEEEDWIRRGVKARTKRNVGRVRALHKMRETAANRRDYERRPNFQPQTGEEPSRRIIETHRLNVSINGNPVLKRFTCHIRRGDIIGIMGPNGCGKTTLLRTLLGEHEPDSGTIKYGENLQIAYFDQNRQQLNLDKEAAWNVADGAEQISVGNKNIHVLGYLKGFLFSPDRARTQTALLSGGERNRLLLARLFAKQSNVLVLDEPTNDLDLETLEMLEEKLISYAGTIVLVSHDRSFVDHIVNALLIYEPGSGFVYHLGNYSDWTQRKHNLPIANESQSAIRVEPSRAQEKKSDKIQKLGYRESQELSTLPERIESLDQEIAELEKQMTRPEFFRNNSGEIIRESTERLDSLREEREAAYQRWEMLEVRNIAYIQSRA